MHGDAEFARLFRARPLRFVLPLRQPPIDTPSERNIITIKTVHQNAESLMDRELDFSINDSQNNFITSDEIEYFDTTNCRVNEQISALLKKPAAYRLSDGRIFVKPELLCDVGCETPRINTDLCLGSEYRYFYAISCDMDLNNPGTVSIFRELLQQSI